jgi:ribonuclease VapC
MPAAIPLQRGGLMISFEEAGISIEQVTKIQAQIAREAYRDFGKGSGHPAKLNFGDCFAYALAKECGEPLLFKGGDFARTDIVAV